MAGRPGVRKIVNISSNGAYNFDVFDPPHYRASKAAMDTLTKDLARRYAREKHRGQLPRPGDDGNPALRRRERRRCWRRRHRPDAPRPRHAARGSGCMGGSFLISPAGDMSSGNVIILNQGRDVR
jgi:2-dehydro-3-deoxy-L-rhamnonate dehydrogenase (NAD+)